MEYELRARRLLKEHGFRQDTRLGQHFLLKEEWLSAIVEDAQIEPGDRILEIGPGAGTLSAQMLLRGARVVGVELDERLLPVLSGMLYSFPEQWRIVHGDILKIDLEQLWREHFEGQPFRVVANLPYYITADTVTRLVKSGLPITSLHVLIQKEAAQRMMAPVGAKEYGVLALTVQYYAELSMGLEIPPAAFEPPPHVISQVLHMAPWQSPPVKARDPEHMFWVIRAAFAMRRKTLSNNLCAALSVSRERLEDIFSRIDVDGRARGETLTLNKFAQLSDALLAEGILEH